MVGLLQGVPHDASNRQVMSSQQRTDHEREACEGRHCARRPAHVVPTVTARPKIPIEVVALRRRAFCITFHNQDV